MKRSIIKLNGFLLILTICIFMNGRIINSSADELEEPVIIDEDWPYLYVRTATCDLSITSGNASVVSNVSGEVDTTSTSVTVYLEKYIDDYWQTYSSWYHSGGRSQNNTDSTNVGHGLYRVRMYVTASTSDGNSESFGVTGNTVLYWL